MKNEHQWVTDLITTAWKMATKWLSVGGWDQNLGNVRETESSI